jgi:hypothetical protein
MDKKEIRDLIKQIDESLVMVEKLKLQAKEALAGMERRSRKPKLTLVKSDKQKKPA